MGVQIANFSVFGYRRTPKKWGLELIKFLGIFFCDSLHTHAMNLHSKFEGIWTMCCGFISIWIMDIFHEKFTGDHS